MVEIRHAGTSLAALRKDQNQAMMATRRAGIPADLDINVRENRVELNVAGHDSFHVAVRRGDLRLPPGVKVTTGASLAVPESHRAFIQGESLSIAAREVSQ